MMRLLFLKLDRRFSVAVTVCILGDFSPNRTKEIDEIAHGQRDAEGEPEQSDL
jgi:hypothetical protein